jgi:aspartate/methionine/tyrosine aminotransferase
MFENQAIDIPLLQSRAFNLRWASVPADVIPLTAADPDFPIAPAIKEAIIKYTTDGYFSYNDPLGYHPLKSALASKYVTQYHTAYSPENILPVNSAAFGIHLVCKALLNPGDEVIIFDPVDFLFKHAAEAAGAVTIPFAIPPSSMETDFSAMEALITQKTKLICLCNPLNPTGKVFTYQELKKLAELVVKYNLTILSDEIWSDIVFDNEPFTPIASLDKEIFNRTITVTGFSKSFGLAGLRIGAVLAPDTKTFNTLYKHTQHQSTAEGCNIIGQVAAHAALTACSDWLALFLDHLHQMRSLVVNGLQNIPGISCIPPQGCYVAFADIRATGISSEEMHQLLLNKAKVAVVPGLPEWFGTGASGYIRLSFATSSSILQRAIENITKTLYP